MPAPHVETAWYLAIPVQYRDRVSFDPITGLPTYIDVAAGAYTVPGALTDTDRAACRLPALIARERGWR